MTRRQTCWAGSLACLASCSGLADRQPVLAAIVGGHAINPNGETIPDSAIIVLGARIRRIGTQADLSIPSGSEVWSIKNRYLIPAPVELGQGVRMTAIGSMEQATTAMIKTPEAAEGIVDDADEMPPGFVDAFLRASTVVVPRLAKLAAFPDRLARGLKNVRTLHEAGVRIASFGEKDAGLEWQLLARAGLSPQQVLETATTHAARVARLEDAAGAIRAGFYANLWVLRLDPLASADHLSSVESIMIEGAWQNKPGTSQ